VAIIKRMVRDLNFPVTIATAPTLREPDGLAMSSRNVYLNAEERQQALGLSRALAAVVGFDYYPVNPLGCHPCINEGEVCNATKPLPLDGLLPCGGRIQRRKEQDGVVDIRQLMRSILEQHGLRVDYVEIVDADTLMPVENVMKGNVAVIAAYCGKTRLIDNQIL
jgi:pantoate--beta-alanine ligase